MVYWYLTAVQTSLRNLSRDERAHKTRFLPMTDHFSLSYWETRPWFGGRTRGDRFGSIRLSLQIFELYRLE